MRATYSERTVLAAMKRVLRLVDGYLARQEQNALITDGRGLMTWGEIRHHVVSASKLRVRRKKS